MFLNFQANLSLNVLISMVLTHKRIVYSHLTHFPRQAIIDLVHQAKMYNCTRLQSNEIMNTREFKYQEEPIRFERDFPFSDERVWIFKPYSLVGH